LKKLIEPIRYRREELCIKRFHDKVPCYRWLLGSNSYARNRSLSSVYVDSLLLKWVQKEFFNAKWAQSCSQIIMLRCANYSFSQLFKCFALTKNVPLSLWVPLPYAFSISLKTACWYINFRKFDVTEKVRWQHSAYTVVSSWSLNSFSNQSISS